MKIYQACKFKTTIKRAAKQVGLDLIDYNNLYTLIKTSSTNPSGYSNGPVLHRACFEVVGSKDGKEMLVWLYGYRHTGEWFKTSPISKVIKVNNGYEITTQNSVYFLVVN